MSDRVPLRIPKVSMAAEEVTFIEWLIDDGAAVREGDPLYSLATDKVETDVEAAASGLLRHGDVQPNEDYQVGAEIGHIEVAAP